MQKNKIVVVRSAMIGGDKEIKELPKNAIHADVDYITFTNNGALTGMTDDLVTVIPLVNGNPRRTARDIKTLIHEYVYGYEYWVWIDANMQINVHPADLVHKYLKNHDICAMPHPERNNWVEEASMCASSNRDDHSKLELAYQKYISEGHMPTSLYETGCLLRRNTPKVNDFNRTWNQEIYNRSIRDQVSFTYAAWKHGLAINTFPGTNSVNQQRYQVKPYIPQWGEITRAWN